MKICPSFLLANDFVICCYRITEGKVCCHRFVETSKRMDLPLPLLSTWYAGLVCSVCMWQMMCDLLQPVNSVPVLYLSSLRSIHNLLIVCSVMRLHWLTWACASGIAKSHSETGQCTFSHRMQSALSESVRSLFGRVLCIKNIKANRGLDRTSISTATIYRWYTGHPTH